MSMRSLFALSSSLALISCNFVPDSFNKTDEKPDTLALLKAGDAKACSADDVKGVVASLVRKPSGKDERLDALVKDLQIELSTITMSDKNETVHSVDCRGNFKLESPSLNKQSEEIQIAYTVSPSAEHDDQIVVSVADTSGIQVLMVSLLGPELQAAAIRGLGDYMESMNQYFPPPSDRDGSEDVNENATDSMAVPTSQEEADLDQNASDTAAIDVNR